MSSASLTSSLAWRIVVLLEPDLLERRERATPVLMPGKGEWWQAQGVLERGPALAGDARRAL